MMCLQMQVLTRKGLTGFHEVCYCLGLANVSLLV